MTVVTKTLERLNILFLLIIAVCVMQVAVWVFDTAPPFKLLSYTATEARAGQSTLVEATVWRALDRNCSVVFSRHMFDARGVRFDLSGSQIMSADALRALDRISPGKLRLNAVVPSVAAPGPALMVTVLEYRCNPWQEALGKPIRVEMTTTFVITPN